MIQDTTLDYLLLFLVTLESTLCLTGRYSMLYVHTLIYHIVKYSKTSLSRPTMGPTSNDPFKEVVGLGS